MSADKGDGPSHIEINVQQDALSQTYRIRADIMLKKFFDAYLSRHPELDGSKTYFSFEGNILREKDTPRSIGLYQNATISILTRGESG